MRFRKKTNYLSGGFTYEYSKNNGKRTRKGRSL